MLCLRAGTFTGCTPTTTRVLLAPPDSPGGRRFQPCEESQVWRYGFVPMDRLCRQRRRPSSRATQNDRAGMDGISPGGAFCVAQQRPGTRRLAGCGRIVEFVERNLRLGRRRAQRDLDGGAGRGMGRAQCRAVRRCACALFGVACADQRQQRSGGRPARDRGHRLHHRVGRDADLAGTGRQSCGSRGIAGDKFLWHQHHSHRAQRGRLCADVDSGGHHDDHLSSGLHRGGGIGTANRSGAGHRERQRQQRQ